MSARLFLLLPVLGITAFALGPGGAQDPNRTRIRATDPAPLDVDEIFSGVGGDTRTPPLAKAFFPGPPSSFAIQLMIRNDSDTQITNLVLDPFEALDGEALLIESTFSTGAGTTVLYPIGSGRGPLVASFQGFDPGETVALILDPDTYEDASFGATVGDMEGARIGLVFADGSKAVGVFHPSPAGATVAEVNRSDP